MQNQLDNIGDDSKQNNTQNIQTLKQQITFTNAQLYQIINNPDHFNQRIKKLNQKAIKEINQEKYQQAIIYLAEAEKNLEYAASCGLAIDRVLITTVLNNQACAYQRLWELGTCYDYVQALIYNLNIGGDNTKQLMLSEQLSDTSTETSKKFNKLLNKKINLALSYLQFSALSSQLGKHDQAQKLVQKSITQFKDLCDICYSYQKNKKGKTSILLYQIRHNIQFNPKVKIQKLLKQCKAGLQKIKNHRYFFTFDQKIIEKMSMGHIMQIECRGLESAMKLIQTEWFTSQLGLTYIIIYISCCFFALATQIRLGTQKQIASSQTVQSHTKLAKIYHLHAINMASNLVLIQSNFLNHITISFKNNFGIDIPNQNFDQQGGQFDQISQILASQNQRKDQKQRKAQQNQKFRKPINKKNDDQITTKFQTIQSNFNSITDVKQKKCIFPNSKKQSRKVSIIQQKLTKKASKKLLFEQFAADMKRSKSKTNKTSKLKSSINRQKKSISKNKNKLNKLNNEYFSKIQPTKKKEPHTKDVFSPRSKITRKTQQSRSKPKLVFTNIKSPKKL